MLAEKELKNIFDTYYQSLVQFANRFLERIDVCEDLVQDVFITLWKSNKEFPDDVSLKVYLFTATRNKCYNVLKHKKVKERYAIENLKTLENNNDFLKEVLEEDIIRQLHQAISLLPDRKKEIIKLSLKGIKNTEIAEILGIKLQTVKTLKSQSYKILRDQFKEMNHIIYLLFTQ